MAKKIVICKFLNCEELAWKWGKRWQADETVCWEHRRKGICIWKTCSEKIALDKTYCENCQMIINKIEQEKEEKKRARTEARELEKRRIKEEYQKKETNFINSYIAERKKENSCESAVRAFFTLRKIVKRKVGMYQEDNITLFRMIELLKNGNLFYQDHTTNVNIDLEKFYQPWIIELISKTSCEHKWCGIIRNKIGNQND